MTATLTRKGSATPSLGQYIGVVNATSSESTTVSINVSTVSGYSSVTSIVFATAVPAFDAATAVTTTVGAISKVEWTTTDAIIKVTTLTNMTTKGISVFFIGK